MIPIGDPDITILGIMDMDTDSGITMIPGIVTGDIQVIITVIITMEAGPQHRWVGDIQRLVLIRKGIGVDAAANWFKGPERGEIAGITVDLKPIMMEVFAPRMIMVKVVV
jgi:hypothetical protein